MTLDIPILVVSDAVSGSTGLGRITREIAARANAELKDVCRIATLGYGGPGTCRLNFQQYTIEGMGNDFVVHNLPEVWDDWAGKQEGVILFIWDASRLGWFSRPEVMCESPGLKSFLTRTKFSRWIYCPADAEGPNQKLTYPLTQALAGFDRVLAYGGWAEELLRRTFGAGSGGIDLTSIPHGIDSSIFYPRPRLQCRANFFPITQANSLRATRSIILGDEPLIGTIATNQTRKDWGLWAESCAMFLRAYPKAHFWIHTDVLERHWSIPALLVDFGLIDRTVVSLGCLDDNRMAEAYSACDLTLGIGLGEGFGYPIFESLFCGTPCIHGDYGGAPEHMEKHLLVKPVAYRYEGVYACKRPVFSARDWADRMVTLFKDHTIAVKPEHLAWNIVWPQFDAWFRKGLST